jgi:hypothetical protein
MTGPSMVVALLWSAAPPVVPLSGPVSILICQQRLDGAEARETVELEAKRKALASWTALTTSRHGINHARWQNAFNRRIDCRRDATLHVCVAHARPCAPAYRIPEGVTPLKRRPLAE